MRNILGVVKVIMILKMRTLIPKMIASQKKIAHRNSQIVNTLVRRSIKKDSPSKMRLKMKKIV